MRDLYIRAMVESKDKAWFVEWFDSEYYHILYSDRNEEEAAAFIGLLLERFSPSESGVILDLACGKGRHSRHISSLGYRVHGIDLSPESIAHCQSLADEKSTFAVHDMRRPYLPGSFDMVVNLFTSFGYFKDMNENVQVLRSIEQELSENGRFVIDFLNVVPVMDELPNASTFEKGGITFDIQKQMVNGRIEKTIQFEDKGQEYKFVEKVQALVLNDMQQMLAKAGLYIEHVFGDYLLNPFNKDRSPRLIIIGGRN